MSCYEWERGTIKIPSKAWAGFKKDLRQAFNDLQTEAFESAKRIHAALLVKASGQRNIKCNQWSKWWEDLAMTGFGVSKQNIPNSEKIYHTLGIAFLTMNHHTEKKITRPTRPMKKDFPLATGKTTRFDVGGEADIILHDDNSRSVTWDVPENNHAREHAREEVLAEKFFGLLDDITWTRNSGGTIIGNDEYSREAGQEHEGGGGSYLIDTFGPGVKKKEATFRWVSF